MTHSDEHGKLVATTCCHFIKDLKHDWKTDVIGVEKDIEFKKQKSVKKHTL